MPIGRYYGEKSGDKPLSNSVLRIIATKGMRYALKKGFYKYPFRLLHRVVRSDSFAIDDHHIAYFNAPYNTTYANERGVEIAIAKHMLELHKGSRVLEIGNVLGHYENTRYWDVVDKYETSPGVVNLDILDYNPGVQYDFVFSISTIEHIGFDEKDKDPAKIRGVLKHVLDHLLAPQGCLLVTFPLGWNPALDSDFIDCGLPFREYRIFQRNGWKNNWSQLSAEVHGPFKYGTFIGADYLVIALAGSSHDRSLFSMPTARHPG